MYLLVLSVIVALATILGAGFYTRRRLRICAPGQPLSVNYHFTRQCNYGCGFCFHTAKTSHRETIENAKRGLRLLHAHGTRKINFSGGEPFLEPRFLGELCRFCKVELDMESVSIVSNGSKITDLWMSQFGQFVDILAVSCDSFREETNRRIGRGTERGTVPHASRMSSIAAMCRTHGIIFKVNSVINAHNWTEDMNAEILALAPKRWKVLQVLMVDGENINAGTRAKDASAMCISDAQFRAFVERHAPCHAILVPEDNQHMRTSYLILDEYMRFLDCSSGGKIPSRSILDVGVEEALKASGFNEQMFFARGGLYNWSRRPRQQTCSSDQTRVDDIEDMVLA